MRTHPLRTPLTVSVTMVLPITMRLLSTENSKAQRRIHAYTKQKKVQYVYDYYLAITIYLTEIALFRYLNKK